MAFDNSANFSFTGTSQNWVKPKNISNVYFIVKGAGGSGSTTNSGGGGAYVFSNYNYLNFDISYNVEINIGCGAKAPYTDSEGILQGGPGGLSVGGLKDTNGNYLKNSNGGTGTVKNGLQSGGGGGMTSIIYMDTSGNNVIKIIAGGGGGGGTNTGGKGGDSFKIGVTGSGLGGGQGGNTFSEVDPPNPAFPPGNAGLGGIVGGVNGYNYVDTSLNGLYTYIGGGGGGGGSFAGGGGGGGYGGGAGGTYGGGGGGGSYASLSARNVFIAGAGGKGGNSGQDAVNGSVRILWNSQIPKNPPVIVSMLMLNAQHSSKSIYTAPTVLPTNIKKYFTLSSTFSNHGVIGADKELYFIADDGILYSFDHQFNFSWNFVAPFGKFAGTPALSNNGTLYISSVTTDSQNYFFAVVDTGGYGGGGSPIVKWNYPINGKSASSPIMDLSGVVYFGTDNGYIYGLTDYNYKALPLWPSPYKSPDNNPITNPISFNADYSKICYTTSNSITSYLHAIDLSKNILPQKTSWSPISFPNEICGMPSIDENGHIYMATNLGNVYAYDISNGQQLWKVQVNDFALSSIAIDNNDRIYFTSQKGLNVIDSSNGSLEWVYLLDSSGGTVAKSIPTIDASNNIYFGGFDSNNNYLHSINATVRSFNWKYKVDAAIQCMPIISNNQNIYFGANDGFIYDLSGNGSNPFTSPIVPMYMLNPQHTGLSTYHGPSTTPALFLSKNFAATNLYVSPSIGIASDGTIYIGSNNGYVHALNPIGLTTKWSVQVNNTTDVNLFTSPNSMYTTPAIGQNGTIYIGSNEGYLYALNPTNGSIKWSYNAGYPLQSSPILDSGGNIYFGAGQSVYSIADGGNRFITRWLVPFVTGANVNSSPALGQNGLLYFGSDDGYLYAVNSLNGLLAWPPLNLSLPDTTHPIYTSATVDASNNVIIGNGSYMDGSLNYIDGITGAILWQTSYEPENGPFYNTVAVKDDTIYLSTIAYVFAIDRLTGALKWKFFSLNCYYTSPIVDASGIIYVASINANSNHGVVHALKDNGNSVVPYWPPYDSGVAFERFAPPVLGNNKTIYISSSANVNSNAGNKIYALK